jgi:hypothetical protein
MPKGLRILHLSFKDPCLTHFGGMILIQRFCNKLRLRWMIQKYVKIPQRNINYLPSDLILALLYAIMAGMRRINKTEILQYNGAFLSLLGLPRFPDQSTLRRFLKRIPPKAIRQLVTLHDQLRTKLFALPKPRFSLIFDLDSVVLTIYGKAQFARVGYNPKKRGRRSYHPILWFLTPRKHRHGYRGRAFYQSLSLQSSKEYRPLSPPISGRLGILQQKSSRIVRPGRLWLCDCGQTLPHDQIPGFGMPLPKTEKWLGDSRVSIPTSSLEDPAPFYRRSTSYPRRPSGGEATHSLQIQEICLPCLGHQFEDSSLESLEILRPEGHHRKECSRTPLRLSSGQDSNRRLGGQCGFLSHAAVGLQYCPLVQKAVSFQRLSLWYTGYDPHRLLSLTSKIDQKRKPKSFGTASGLPLPRAVRKCSQENRQTQDPEKFMNLQMINFLRCGIFNGFQIKNALSTHF